MAVYCQMNQKNVFGIPFEEREELDTIAGWIQYQLLDTAKIGDQVEQGDRLWTVTDMDNYQIKEVSLTQNAFKTIQMSKLLYR